MTDSYLTLTTFIPGTKAKADEVNANFSALKDAVNTKAAVSGDSTKVFSVANATAEKHAVNKSQMDLLSANLKTEIAKAGVKFCVKSGNTTAGSGDLFSYDVLRITPKIGGTYPNLVFLDYEGTQSTISSTPAYISMTGKPDGSYNIFIKPDGTLYTLANKIYKQPSRPTLLDGDIWLNTSVEPFNCIKYDGTNDVKFLDVPLGKVTIASAAITKLETFAFNQNGHSISTQTTLDLGTKLAASIPHAVMPDYANGASKSWATVYQAENDGYLYVWAAFGSTLRVSLDNSTWTTVQYSWHSDQGFSASSFVPIPKGVYYKATNTSSGSSNSLVFYPCLGR